MTMSRFTGILVSAVLLTIAATSVAQPAPEGAAAGAPARPSRDWASLSTDPGFRERLERWRSMSEAEKEQIRARHRQWRNLSESDRGRLAYNLVQFRSLSSDRQAAMRERFRQLSPEKRQRLMQFASRAHQFTRQHQIPVGPFMDWIRKTPRQELDRVRNLPPEERRAAAREMVRRFQEHAVERFSERLPEREREAFHGLPFEEKLTRIRRWYAERHAREGDGSNRLPAPDAPKSAPRRDER
jgi:hypothetical protein